MTAPQIEIAHADATDLGRDFLGQFQTLIVDPPYSAHVHDHATSIGVDGRGVRERDLGFGALTPELRGAIALASASVSRWSVIFSDHEGAHEWRDACDSAGAEYIRTVPWVRWSQPQLSGDRPCTGSEAVLHFHAQNVGPRGGRVPIAKYWNGPGSLTHYARRALRGQHKHPTEKPLDLMLDLVAYYSDPGDAVLDLCGGAGTTAIACALLGRDCLVVERDLVWCSRARSRLASVGAWTSVDRDRVRAAEWVDSVTDEASSVPEPKAADGSDVKTYERALRRLEAARVVAEAIG